MNLKEIMMSEFSTKLVENNTVNDELMGILEENGLDTDEVLDVVTEYEKYAFDQGFLRGLAAARGGLMA